MKANIRFDALGDITVHLEGVLSYERHTHFKEELEKLVKSNPSSTIILDFNKIDFVGSSGIGHFTEVLLEMNKGQDRIKLTNVKKEFLKFFQLYGPSLLHNLIEEFESDSTQNLNWYSGGRKKTFQN